MPKKMVNDDFYSILVQERVVENESRLKFYLNYLFANTELKNARVLDIGGGWGLYSFCAAHMGAKEVVCIEPRADGSSPYIIEKFYKISSKLGMLDRVVLKAATLQEFNANNSKFNVILLHNSINHLNESACIHLLEDEKNKDIYKEIFAKIYQLLEQEGRLIVCDCSRYNFFALLKLRNPFAPSIEWHKHQTPDTWVSLLRQVGFSCPKIRWTSFDCLYSLGRLLLGNRFAAYLYSSHFCLTMEKK